MKKYLGAGAKVLGVLASLFMAFSFASCDDGGSGDSSPTLNAIVAGESLTLTKGDTFPTTGIVFAYYDNETVGTYSQPGSDAHDVTSKATFTAGSVTFKAGETVSADSGTYTVTVTFGGKTLTDAIALTVKEPSGIALVSGSTSTSYDTIQEAWVAIGESGDYVLKLNAGTYTVPDGTQLAYNGAANIKIFGITTTEYGADVIIKGKGSDQSSSKTRCLMEIQGTGNLVFENVTLQNVYEYVAGASNTQCEALGFDSTGTVAAYNSSFLAHQDTMRTVSKGWFYKCRIVGDVDFIWMESSGIVALYEECAIEFASDERTEGYLLAPRANIATKMGKGAVIFNSSITVPSNMTAAYLFRNPWGTNTNYYNQGAIVDTEITGTLTDTLAKSAAMGTGDQQYVGWKVDSTIGNAYSSKNSTIGVLSDTVKSNEYSGRETILNRVYNVGSSKFQKDTDAYWDIASVISDNGWTVTADSSSSLLSDETESQVTTYEFSNELSTYPEITVGETAFAKENGKSHLQGQAGASLTFPVTGNAVVYVYGYYAGYGTIKAGSQGEAVYDFNNGSTGTTVEKTYVNYSGATDVTITASATSYITKIVVEYDSTLTNTPVTKIDVSADSETYMVGVALKLSATVSPSTATNKDVKWTSNDTSIATIDEITGKVTFVAAGDASFTVTARDGSGTTGTFSCTAKEANWTVAEWYTIDATTAVDAAVETTCQNGDVFSPTSSNKSLSAETSFTNIAGETISTKYGLKLNSSGNLKIATTTAAQLTIITFGQNTITQPGVAGAAEGSTATLLSSNVGDTGEQSTYVFKLSGADTWTIDRTPATSEINPIVYAKVELAPVSGTAYNLTGGVGTPYTSTDQFLTVTASSDNGGHGLIMKANNNFTIVALGGAKITLGNCAYDNAFTLTAKDSSGANAIKAISYENYTDVPTLADGVISVPKGGSGNGHTDKATLTIELSTTALDTITVTWASAEGQTYLHSVTVD